MQFVDVVLQQFRKRRTIITYTSGSLFNSFAQIISSIIILAYVGPDQIGIWNTIILFQTYSLFLQAGVMNGLNRELPFYLGRNERNFAESLSATALFYFLIAIGLCAITGVLLFILSDGDSEYFTKTFIVVIIITLTKFYEDYLTSTYRSDNAFEKLARAYWLRGVFLLISILFVISWGYNGYLLRMVLTSFLFTIFLHRIRPIKVTPSFRKENFLLLLKVGLPIFSLGYLLTVSGTLDRALLVKKAGFVVVGYYSLALMVYNAFKTFPVSLANYIYPKMSYEYGQNNDPKNLSEKSLKINALVFVIMLPIAILGYFVLPEIIPLLFPQYTEGVRAAQILLFAAVFSGATIGVNVLWSMKIWKYVYFHQISSALMNLLFIWFGFRLSDDPLLGVSLGVFASQLFYMALSNYLIFRFKKQYQDFQLC
jgi:O-antigen/teichoic acid export membrane protein